ncbi:STAS domain-containing protein [Cellulomonas shaoxiangyii]|uniref:Anti-sigma factor antagonist n=1 Tax=Cellulomonas shaoxiangyii TaxID=2566013 RepID=A0A4P7SJ21_9CELL|nr:STAS domain-containing protein [Cellulomonas shaoxiangyii]QCB94112.1 anti-sigma factor antagonist [Cellulomonas shaoxiangyii]
MTSVPGGADRPGADRAGRLDVRRDGGMLRVVLHGAVDLQVREQDAPVLWAQLAGPDVHAVALDAADVSFLDSSGLSVVVRLVRDAAERGLPVHVEALSRPVEELLDQTGVRAWMDHLAASTPQGARR